MLIDGDILVVRNAPIALRKLGGSSGAGLAAEIAARIAGDAALSAAIAVETAARIYNETLLKNQITSNVIPLGDAVTIPADYNIIVAGPMTIAGTLTVSGYFGSVY